MTSFDVSLFISYDYTLSSSNESSTKYTSSYIIPGYNTLAGMPIRLLKMRLG